MLREQLKKRIAFWFAAIAIPTLVFSVPGCCSRDFPDDFAVTHIIEYSGDLVRVYRPDQKVHNWANSEIEYIDTDRMVKFRRRTGGWSRAQICQEEIEMLEIHDPGIFDKE